MKPELTTQGFELFLQDKCFEENPMVLDDDMPDYFDNWLVEQDTTTITAYAGLYAHQQGKLLAEHILKMYGNN